MRGFIVGLLIGLFVVAKAGGQIGPTITPFTPPASYRVIWNTVEKCAGSVSDPGAMFHQIKWLLRSITVDEAGDTLIAQWVPPDSIFFTVGMPRMTWQDTVWVVAHEMLHHKLGVYNDPGTPHPWIPFAFPCRLMAFQQTEAGIMRGRGY